MNIDIDFSRIDWNEVQSIAPFIFIGAILFLVMFGVLLELVVELLGSLLHLIGILVYVFCYSVFKLVNIGMRLVKKSNRSVVCTAVGLFILALVVLITAYLKYSSNR